MAWHATRHYFPISPRNQRNGRVRVGMNHHIKRISGFNDQTKELMMESANLKFLTFAAVSLFNASCGLSAGGPGLQIFDYEAGKTVATIKSGTYREMLCRDVTLDKSFFTISQEKQSLVFRKRDQDGVEQVRYEQPLLNKVWHEPNWFSVSPNGDKIAYWNEKNNSLLVRNFQGPNEVAIFKGGKDSSDGLQFIAWQDEQNVVIATSSVEGDKEIMRIHKIRISGSEQVARTGIGSFPFMKLSPNHTSICGVISASNMPAAESAKGDQIVIFDLKTMTERVRIPRAAPEQTVLLTGWAANSNIIGFSIQSTVDKVSRKGQFLYNLQDHTMVSVPETDKFRNMAGTVVNGGLIAWISRTKRYVVEE